jgi:hypothetical protein
MSTLQEDLERLVDRGFLDRSHADAAIARLAGLREQRGINRAVDAAFDKIAEGMADAVIALTNAREAERPAAGDQEDPGGAGLPERLHFNGQWIGVADLGLDGVHRFLNRAEKLEAAARYNAWGRLMAGVRLETVSASRRVMEAILAEERQKL